MHAIYIHSSTISGAEKRALKLYHSLNLAGITCKLILSKTLFDLFNSSEYHQYLGECIVLKPGWLDKSLMPPKSSLVRTLRKYTGFSRLLSVACGVKRGRQINKLIKDKFNNISILHIFLDLSTAICIKKGSSVGKVIFEISSPDFVRRLSNINSNILNNIDYFNAVSNSTYLKSKEFIPSHKLGHAPIPFFSPNEYDVNQDNLFKLKENIIVFAHRLYPRKNALLFARVAKEFVKLYPSWKIKILGKGPQSVEIQDLLAEEIISGQIEAGYTTRILSELERSKIFVSLIEPDNYPSQSVLEAMYTGNALLLSDCGFTRERFFQGNGVLCKPDFESALAGLINLVNSELYLEQYGRNSLKLLHSRFDKSIYLDYITQTYGLVASTRSS